MSGPVRQRLELIGCHDCGRQISFTAARCPGCGSREPSGPYRHSAREKRRYRAEYRNDRTLMRVTLMTCAGGLLYGALAGSTAFRAVLLAGGYGVLGLILGPPVAFTLNLFRR